MAGNQTRGDSSAVAAPGGGGFVRVKVGRSDPAAREEFDVPAAEPMVVLDVLLALQRHCDASLVFRFSCRAGRCGTCTMRLNGRAVLACQTPVAEGAELVIEPLGGLPVVKDLVVDMSPFQANWSEIVRLIEPRTAATPSVGPEQALLDSSRECISCGACYAACPVAASGRDFLGPAALARAAGDPTPHSATRTATVLGPRGFPACHSVGACSIVCPRALDPALLIRSLRRGRRGRVS
jgi:succinate dehydrogenase / fumarate reductase iron-sulfur subunit/fumarate reductase iron-sulfur subunit